MHALRAEVLQTERAGGEQVLGVMRQETDTLRRAARLGASALHEAESARDKAGDAMAAFGLGGWAGRRSGAADEVPAAPPHPDASRRHFARIKCSFTHKTSTYTSTTPPHHQEDTAPDNWRQEGKEDVTEYFKSCYTPPITIQQNKCKSQTEGGETTGHEEFVLKSKKIRTLFRALYIFGSVL